VVDATHSVGGAVGGIMVGLLLAQGGWPLVFLAWTLLPLIAIGFIGAVRYQRLGRAPRA
jgi:hypothetical protein